MSHAQPGRRSRRRDEDYQPQPNGGYAQWNAPQPGAPQESYRQQAAPVSYQAGWQAPPDYVRSPGYGYQPEVPPRKRRRVFIWVFLVIQVLFVIWIIVGLVSHGSGPTVAQQVAKYCASNGWKPLFTSYADCKTHYAVALNDASDTGKGLGIALVIVFWCVVDFLVGGGYAIYRLASRRR